MVLMQMSVFLILGLILPFVLAMFLSEVNIYVKLVTYLFTTPYGLLISGFLFFLGIKLSSTHNKRYIFFSGFGIGLVLYLYMVKYLDA